MQKRTQVDRPTLQNVEAGDAAPPPNTTRDDVLVVPPAGEELPGTALVVTSGNCARLVVTEPFTGEAFVLDRPSMVIGRTKDNDVVLNYKSISRHHAEIVRDGERYLVVDLRSANGVRVNGTEYKRVGLRPGDVLALGHVRLRFDDPTARPRRTSGFAAARTGVLLGVGVAVAVMVVMLLVRNRDDSRASSVTTTSSGSTQSAPAGSGPSPAAGQPPAQSAAALLASARDAFRQRKWAEALALERRASAMAPGLPGAATLRVASESERQNGLKIDALVQSLDRKEYDAVIQGTAAIPDTSWYHAGALALARTATSNMIAERLERGQKLRSEKNCTDARKEAEAVLAAEPGNVAAKKLLRHCTHGPESKTSSRASAAPLPAAQAVTVTPTPSPAVAAPAAPAPVPPEPRAGSGSEKGEKEKGPRRPIDSIDPYARDRL
jgi:hypothetical protein